MDHPQNNFSPWRKYFPSYVGYGKSDNLYHKFKGIFRMFYSFEAKRKIGKLLDDFQPDIVHIHNIYHQISPSILPEIKKRKIPIVMTVHDYKLICPNYLLEANGYELTRLNWKSFIRNRSFKNSYLKSLLVVLEFYFHRYLNIYDKNIDVYLVPSQLAKIKLVAGGVPENKIILLPHFAIPKNYCTVSRVNIQRPYAFYFGQISRDKGVDKLINIFRALPDINLYLAGKIEDDFVLPKNTNVCYLGFLKTEELEKYLEHASCVVSTSRLPETFGLIALEALNFGKPFIGFSGRAFEEIVVNNHCGFICENEKEMMEKIKLICFDQGLRILFSRNALERSKDFSSTVYLQKLTEIFNQLIKSKNS